MMRKLVDKALGLFQYRLVETQGEPGCETLGLDGQQAIFVVVIDSDAMTLVIQKCFCGSAGVEMVKEIQTACAKGVFEIKLFIERG